MPCKPGSRCCIVSTEDCGTTRHYDEWSSWELMVLFYPDHFLDCRYTWKVSPGSHRLESFPSHHSYIERFQWSISAPTSYHDEDTDCNLYCLFSTLTSQLQKLSQSYQVVILEWCCWAILDGLAIVTPLWFHHHWASAPLSLIHLGSLCQVVCYHGGSWWIGISFFCYPVPSRVLRVWQRYTQLKQVTSHDHCAVQRYLIGAVANSVPWRFLMALRTLCDFRYLTQAPTFTDHSPIGSQKLFKNFIKTKMQSCSTVHEMVGEYPNLSFSRA